LVSDYRIKKAKRCYDEDFIRDSFGNADSEKKAADEIRDIKFELHRSNINDLTAEWVKEWLENRKKNVGSDSKSKEIRDFISSSLGSETVVPEESKPEIRPDHKYSKGIKRSLLLRYISLLAAAAALGVFILIRTLLPSFNPEKLYSSYYVPFDVVSPMTRGDNTNAPDKFLLAVEKYRTGNYKAAASSFSELLLNDSSFIASRFLLGITFLAMNDLDNAVVQLDELAGRSNNFGKEAAWYLGLAYLKKGEKEKAAKCLEFLAQSPGYYNERSKEILRRLK
jgi:hypothetical protein